MSDHDTPDMDEVVSSDWAAAMGHMGCDLELAGDGLHRLMGHMVWKEITLRCVGHDVDIVTFVP